VRPSQRPETMKGRYRAKESTRERLLMVDESALGQNLK
jgi:hypothetical protein